MLNIKKPKNTTTAKVIVVSPINLPPPADQHTPGYWYEGKPKTRYLTRIV